MRQRVITATLLIPPVLLAVFLYGRLWLFLLALIASAIAYVELVGLAMKRPAIPVLGPVAILGIPFLLPHVPLRFGYGVYVQNTQSAIEILAILSLVGAIGASMIARGARGYLVTELASLWIVAPLLCLVYLKADFSDSIPIIDAKTPVWLCLIPVWVGDTLAIFAGRAFGKHLLAPTISPKKTIEGGIANLVGCVAAAITLALLIGQPLLVGVFAGIAGGILGQLGDLLESALKRNVGVKDSGTLLPGHGGLLDRIDSLLLSAPAIALIVVTLGAKP